MAIIQSSLLNEYLRETSQSYYISISKYVHTYLHTLVIVLFLISGGKNYA
jgi:hypothetical protein